MQDFQYFEVLEDGTQKEIKSFDKKDTKVYVVVDHEARVISLWKGTNANIRLKFVGSRASGDSRKQFGYHYRLETMDQDDETDSFKERVFGEDVSSTKPKQGDILEGDMSDKFTSYAEAAAAQGINLTEEEVEQATGGPGGAVGKMGGLGQRPQKSILAPGAMDEAPVKETKAKKQIEKVLLKDHVKEAKEILQELGQPRGYTREMVIVGSKVYRSEGDEKIKFSELETPLDGIILVNEYTPRMICENGAVKLIELLKRTGEEIEAEEMVMTQELEDLAAMFMIDIE